MFLCALLIASCSSDDKVKSDDKGDSAYPLNNQDERRVQRGKLSGEGGLKLFGGSDSESRGSSGIGVNSFLWRATLDTLSFIPLSSVDPHGGVIITDWYEDPKSRGERFKLNAMILGMELRADGVRVSVFRQTQDTSGIWRDSEVSADMGHKLEDKILTRARELKIASTKEKGFLLTFS